MRCDHSEDNVINNFRTFRSTTNWLTLALRTDLPCHSTNKGKACTRTSSPAAILEVPILCSASSQRITGLKMILQILISLCLNIQITRAGLITSGAKSVEIKNEKTGEVVKVKKKEGISPPTLLQCSNSGRATGVATSQIQVVTINVFQSSSNYTVVYRKLGLAEIAA